jgi:hypothetical protein
MNRLLLVVSVGCILLTCGALLFFLELPSVVVCDRRGPNIEISSTSIGGYFEEHRIGPCVTYTHKSSGGD